LFWIVELPDNAIHISNDGRRASVHAENVPVIDSFQFGGPNSVPANVTYSVEWEAIGLAVSVGKGNNVPPTDPAAFRGEFSPAIARGSFSGSELAFSFKADPGASSTRGYAELGRERNGVFL
jgi:hypothetical protein